MTRASAPPSALGANAIIWTPPTSGELFRDVMKNYREGKPHP